GMRTIMSAHDSLIAGSVNTVVAGGMESMSQAPYLLQRQAPKLGHQRVLDHMMYDGLEDAYDKGRSMGTFAQDCADFYEFSRQEQDAFAIESVRRAQRAHAEGGFADEITDVAVASRDGVMQITQDEGPSRINTDRIPTLRPAFREDGTVTAASSSSINDGAAAVVLMRASHAQALGLKPMARIVGHATHAQAPQWFTTAPITAIKRLLDRIHWTTDDVDLWEINEAFAVVTMAAMRDLGIAHDKVNVHGGACALGHPIGASGARIVVTLLHALKRQGVRRGVASLCIGGGEATALAVELV
ncbi:MAG TPA: acetyl-CoA C-acyltransferase, partial [Orrella sp.]